MNTINEMQNEDESILFLAAQAKMYSSAKMLLRIKEILVVVIPILLSLLYSTCPAGRPYFQLYSFIIIFVDMILLESIISSQKKKAALVQELFDTKVLELDKTIIGYDYPSRSEIQLAADKIKNKERFNNWYNTDIEILPIEIAKLVCQRININWDRVLRRKSINILLAFVVAVTFGLLIKEIRGKSLLEDYIAILVMMIPFYRYYTKYIQEQVKATKGLLNVEQSIDKEIEKCVHKEEGELANRNSRIIQDYILLGRIQYPLASDTVYKLSKPTIRRHNIIDVKYLVQEIQEKLT